MLAHKAYKTELKPNNKQIIHLLKHAGCARKAWNWALDKIQKKESKPNAMQLHKEINIEKKDKFAYMYEVSKCAMQESLRDLQTAFKNFFDKRTGFPKYKTRNKGIGSFRLTGNIRVEDKRIKLPRLGWIRLKEDNYLPKDKHILSATVSEKAGKWFVSILIQEEIEIQNTNKNTIGIDLGIKKLATCSDNTSYDNSKVLFQIEDKLKYYQRRLSKKVKGSKRRKKLQRKIARLWLRIANVRKDLIHKTTSEIVKTKQPKMIVMENLNISGMMKNHKLAKSIANACMNEFRRQIEYKTLWNGVILRLANRFFPSSKMCSCCGNIKDDLKLSDRIYECLVCGFAIDRDLNASINLENYDTVSSTGINAHGDDKVHMMQ